MPNTFNFVRSCALLNTNPKTFKEWLVKAGIDAERQLNRFDSREKYITKEQLLLLAELHGRTLHLDEEEAQPTQEVTMAMLAERLAALEHQLSQHINQVDQRLDQVQQMMQHVLTSMQESASRQQGTPPSTSVTARTHEHVETASIPAATSPQQEVPTRTKATTSKTRKKKARPLPRTMLPLHAFAQLHHVSEKAADTAAKTGKLTVQRGDWLYNSRHIKEVLAAQGQREFYEAFSVREGFTRCEHCPHGAQDVVTPERAQAG